MSFAETTTYNSEGLTALEQAALNKVHANPSSFARTSGIKFFDDIASAFGLNFYPSSSATSNNSDSQEVLNDRFMQLFRTQSEQNDKNMKFNAEQAELNRQWQEYMSNTSYQRAMKDLEAAGLNPILAYQQGGASVPSGSSASANNSVSYGAEDLLGFMSSLVRMFPALAALFAL